MFVFFLFLWKILRKAFVLFINVEVSLEIDIFVCVSVMFFYFLNL